MNTIELTIFDYAKGANEDKEPRKVCLVCDAIESWSQSYLDPERAVVHMISGTTWDVVESHAQVSNLVQHVNNW